MCERTSWHQEVCFCNSLQTCNKLGIPDHMQFVWNITCAKVVETCRVVANEILSKYIKIPQGDLLEEVVHGFESLLGFPQTVGAFDSTHIPIIKPLKSASDYYNRKGFYSVMCFSNSTLYAKATNNLVFEQMNKKLCGVNVSSCASCCCCCCCHC